MDAPVAARPALRGVSPTGGTAPSSCTSPASWRPWVTHEPPTPLTSVIGYLELAAEDETLDETTAGFLDAARRNADQLLLITSCC